MRKLAVLVAALLVVSTVFASVAPVAEAGKPTPVLQYSDRVWGDILCSGEVDAADAMPVLEWLALAKVNVPAQNCLAVIWGVAVRGYDHSNWRWGDVDCDGTVAAKDVIAILAKAAGVANGVAGSCPAPGQAYPVAITGK